MAFKWRVSNATDLATSQEIFRMDCNCGGQMTFLNLSDPTVATLNTYWIMIDQPARVKTQFVFQVKPGVPVTYQSEFYLQEGIYQAICDNPNAGGADILHVFLTWRPAGPISPLTGAGIAPGPGIPGTFATGIR